MSDNGNSDPEPDSSVPGATDGALSRNLTWGVGLAVLVAVIALIRAYRAYFDRFGSLDGALAGCLACAAPDPRAAWGQFGDFVGGVVNPVVGLLTLLGLATTVWLQMRQIDMGRTQLHLAGKQLDLSRRELELTRRELERSADAQAAAAEAMKGQLEQARLTAQAQTEAAEHQLATAKAMREQVQYSQVAARMQILNGGREALTPTVETYNAWMKEMTQADGGSDQDIRTLRQDCLKQLLALIREKGLAPGMASPQPHSQSDMPTSAAGPQAVENGTG